MKNVFSAIKFRGKRSRQIRRKVSCILGIIINVFLIFMIVSEIVGVPNKLYEYRNSILIERENNFARYETILNEIQINGLEKTIRNFNDEDVSIELKDSILLVGNPKEEIYITLDFGTQNAKFEKHYKYDGFENSIVLPGLYLISILAISSSLWRMKDQIKNLVSCEKTNELSDTI